MNGTKNVRTNSTGTVHAEVDGLPACPTRAKSATPYTPTNDDVTCRHCLKLVAETERIEAEAAGESTAGPRYRIGAAHRLLIAARQAKPSSDEPTPVSEGAMFLAMSLGMQLGIEAVDEYGYQRAEKVIWDLARKELSVFDLTAMTETFLGVMARREASGVCAEDSCLMCEILV